MAWGLAPSLLVDPLDSSLMGPTAHVRVKVGKVGTRILQLQRSIK